MGAGGVVSVDTLATTPIALASRTDEYRLRIMCVDSAAPGIAIGVGPRSESAPSLHDEPSDGT
jgi:hypothetical protein